MGFNIKKIISYNSEPVKKFSDILISYLKEEKINMILFFSARTAQVFIDILEKEKLSPYIKKTDSFVLSRNIADIINYSGFRTVNICNEENSDIMMDLIKRFYISN